MSYGNRSVVWTYVLFAGWIVAGCDSETEAPAQSAPMQVSTLTLIAETIEPHHTLAGRTIASEVSQVRPQVSGLITAQLFREGNFVEAGQPLYQIDPSLYQAAVDQAQANLALARATLKSTELQAQRYRELVTAGGVSLQDLDDAEAAYEQARATIAANEAALATARIQLTYTSVMAPISGRIGRSAVTRGALVIANQEMALATIQKLDPIHVDLMQSSDAYLALGRELTTYGIDLTALTARLQFNDGTFHSQTGTLAFSDIAVDEATGSVTLRVSIPNPGQALLPGMYVRAQLSVGPRPGALLVPQGAVVRNATGEPSVWIASTDDKAERRALILGQAIDNRWHVTNGLQVGERVIIDGLQYLRVGTDIEVVAQP